MAIEQGIRFRHYPRAFRQAVGDERLVYNPCDFKCHLLSHITAEIYDFCDDKTLEEIVQAFASKATESAVLAQLMGLYDIGILVVDPAHTEDFLSRKPRLGSPAEAAAALFLTSVSTLKPPKASSD